MDKSDILKEVQNIHRQGYLHKQSRFFKSWRQRWVVLTNNYFFTFKERRIYEGPTEIVPLKDIISIKATEEQMDMKHTFKLQNNETTFFLAAETALEKENWIGAIGKAMIKRSNMHVEE